MDPVFDAQYLTMKDAFTNAGYEIAVAHTRAGEFDYVYQVDVLLARQVNVPQLQEVLPRLRRDFARPERAYGDLVLLPIGGDGHHDEDGHLTVPQALDLIEGRVGRERMFSDGEPLATAAHIVHTSKLCGPPSLRCRAGPRLRRTRRRPRRVRARKTSCSGSVTPACGSSRPRTCIPGWRASTGWLTRRARSWSAAS